MSEPVLSWTAHPLRDDPRRVALAIGVCALTVVAIQGLFGEWFFSLLALLFLSGTLVRILLPTRFRLDEEGAEIRTALGARRRPWREVKDVVVERKGVFLSRRTTPSPLLDSRGMFLSCPRRLRADVADFARSRLGLHGEPPEC